MINIQEVTKKKKRAFLSLCFMSLIFIIFGFLGAWDTDRQFAGLLILSAWVALFVDYQILSCKLEILKEIQDKEGRDKDKGKDTTE